MSSSVNAFNPKIPRPNNSNINLVSSQISSYSNYNNMENIN